MRETARDQILSRLRQNRGKFPGPPPAVAPPPDPSLNREECVALLKERLEAVRAEVYVVPSAQWIAKLAEITAAKGMTTLLHGPGGPIGMELSANWKSAGESLPSLIAYSEPVESMKRTIFDVDGAVTGTKGAIAELGAIVIQPDQHEPRLMSLVPHIHFAVLDAGNIHPAMGGIIAMYEPDKGMPTNLLFISGPSKTADIEFTLAFGVHGPKELVVLIRT